MPGVNAYDDEYCDIDNTNIDNNALSMITVVPGNYG